MYRAVILAFCALVSCGVAASASINGAAARTEDSYGYDYSKCYAKYQICCNKKYECGYDTEKYVVPKKCYKDECYDEKYPMTAKKCETKYTYKKVCKDDYKSDNSYDYKKPSYRASVRSYDYKSSDYKSSDYKTSDYGEKKQYCYDEKYPYSDCHDYTYYETKQKCYKKEYDCSYYEDKKVAKYCDKYECSEYKDSKVDDHKYFEDCLKKEEEKKTY